MAIIIMKTATQGIEVSSAVTVNVSGGGGIKLLQVISGMDGDYDIYADDVEGIEAIREYCFYNASNISSFDLTNGNTSVSMIGDRAFYGSSVKNVVIPSPTLQEIGMGAFQNSELQTATIGGAGSNYTIKSGAFRGCNNLTICTLSGDISSIATYAFYKTSGASFTLELPEVSSVPTLSSANAFSDATLAAIKVPASLVSQFKTATNWSTYASKIVAI